MDDINSTTSDETLTIQDWMSKTTKLVLFVGASVTTLLLLFTDNIVKEDFKYTYNSFLHPLPKEKEYTPEQREEFRRLWEEALESMWLWRRQRPKSKENNAK